MSKWPSVLPSELHEELNHRVLGALIVGLMTGLGVWATGSTLSQSGAPEALTVVATLTAAGLMPVVTWWLLVRAGV